MEEVKLKIDALKHLEVGFIGLGVMAVSYTHLTLPTKA